MSDYIKSWVSVIENMANDNTYKLAWGRAVIECIILDDYIIQDEGTIQIELSQIVEKMLKYYWNQTFFFDLKQGPNRLKTPLLYQHTQEAIAFYTQKVNLNVPVWYDRVEPLLKQDSTFFQQLIKKMVRTVKQDVSYRFLKANDKVYDLYTYSKDENALFISMQHIGEIKEFGYILIQLLNYKWVQLLEKFNRSPKIASKVKGSQENNIRRSSLSRYRALLLEEFENGDILDFYTGKQLAAHEISIDHVLPWSFMYSDDIWNLVITSKSNNSTKSNKTPSAEQIMKLKERNEKLMMFLKDDNYISEIKLAMEQNLIERYYLDLKSH